MNSINLIGNICNDVELKTTNSGRSVCSFNLAVKRPFTKDTTDFFTVVVWGNQAELIAKHIHKGDKIGITGVLTTRKYTDKDGNNRTAFEIVANNVHFVDSKRSQSGGEGNSLPTPQNDPLPAFADKLDQFQEAQDDGDLPF